MRQSDAIVLAVFFFCAICTANSQTTNDRPIVNASPSVIVAFFAPFTLDDQRDPGTVETWSDFSLYARQAQARLSDSGIHLEIVRADSFRLRAGSKVLLIQPKKACGYYFATTGKPGKLLYGVITADDLLLLARRYFHKSSEPGKSPYR
jgi:hypothetical protein